MYKMPNDGVQKNPTPPNIQIKSQLVLGFPGGAVVKNPPANKGYKGSSPGPGRSHMPWNN